MSETSIYRLQAAYQQADAEAATLTNVRQRCERAAYAWTQMAERVERTDALRVEQRAAAALKDVLC